MRMKRVHMKGFWTHKFSVSPGTYAAVVKKEDVRWERESVK
jgi:hypothetical protein